VAVFALQGGVSSQQRKTILVILHLLYGDIPALDRVALRTVCAHFPLVNVSVAILAILADVGKDWLAMTLCARHLFVHAAKRIFGFVVIELRHGADGTPARSVVAVLARNRKWPMRASGGLTLSRVCLRGSWQPNKKQEPA
jgi:hypothetical protein